MEKVNIIFVLDQLSIGAGVSSIVLDYYEHLNKEKFKIDFAVSKEIKSTLEKKLMENGSEIYYFPELKVKNLTAYKKRWESFLEEHREYKIIHGHMPVMAFIYMRIAKKYQIPVRILHAHNAKGSDRWYKQIRNKCFYSIGINASNEYAACSKKAAEFLFGTKLIEQKRVKLIKNAIKIEKFLYSEEKRKQIRKKYKLEDKFVIGHVGRFSPQKNHKFLIKIFAEYRKNHSDAVLLLIGEGEGKQAIKRQAEKSNIKDEVLFLKPTEEIADFYQAMDVFVLPSKFEGLPIVCMEAQAAGLYCLVSDKIDEEIMITSHIKQVSIKKGIEIWMKALEKVKKRNERTYEQEKLKKKGYDIKTAAENLEKFYLQCLEIKRD